MSGSTARASTGSHFEDSASETEETGVVIIGEANLTKLEGWMRRLKTNMAKKLGVLDPESVNRKQALSRPDAATWNDAMNDEYQSLLNNQVWKPVETLKDRKVLTESWVLRRKLAADGTIAAFVCSTAIALRSMLSTKLAIQAPTSSLYRCQR